MRIAIFSNSSTWGGLETHAVALAETLASAHHEVSVVCFGTHAFELYRGRLASSVKLVDLGPPEQRTFWRWWHTLGTVDADAAILEKGTLWTGSVGLDVALRLRFKRFLTIQQLEPPLLPPKASRRYFGGLMPGLGIWWYRWKWGGYARSFAPHCTVCVSDAVSRSLSKDYGFAERKLLTIRHGVDTELFRASAERRATSRRAWGVPDDAFVFGSIRRFVKEKGLDVAIESLAEVRRRSERDVRLVLIGEGPEETALANAARRLGVAEWVLFPGFNSSPWNAYPAFDAFVMPSRIEALGVVVLEAMASGCFVIGSNVGGIPEMIPDSSIGMLVQPDNARALADAMHEVLSWGYEERFAAAARARQYVIEHYEMRHHYLKIAALLE